MKDFVVMVLGMIIIALALMAYVILGFRYINKTDKCKNFEHISVIKTAMINVTCYRFDNNMFVKVNFNEVSSYPTVENLLTRINSVIGESEE